MLNPSLTSNAAQPSPAHFSGCLSVSQDVIDLTFRHPLRCRQLRCGRAAAAAAAAAAFAARHDDHDVFLLRRRRFPLLSTHNFSTLDGGEKTQKSGIFAHADFSAASALSLSQLCVLSLCESESARGCECVCAYVRACVRACVCV